MTKNSLNGAKIWNVTLSDGETYKVLGHNEAQAIENAGWKAGLPVGVPAADHFVIVKIDIVGIYQGVAA